MYMSGCCYKREIPTTINRGRKGKEDGSNRALKEKEKERAVKSRVKRGSMKRPLRKDRARSRPPHP